MPRTLSPGQKWAMLHRSGHANHGVVTPAMAEACGIAESTFHDRVRREHWRRLFLGVYLLPGARYDHDARATAVVAAFGDRCALSHQSALHLHGLASAPSTLHATLPIDRRSVGAEGITVHRSRTLVAADVVTVRSWPVTSIARTLRDLGASMSAARLYDVVTEAERIGLVDLAALEEQLARQPVGAGRAAFGDVVRQRRSDRGDSALERDTVAFLVANGFHPHPGPYPLRCRSGRTLHLDVAFVPVRHVVECDGMGFHSGRQAFEVDRRRWGQILASDWTISWVTRQRLRDDPDGILDEVRRAHARHTPA